ncbi:MAG: FHA domain-containing protein, partial [Hungatella sp.]
VQDESAATKPLGFEPPVELLQEEIRPVCGWIICIEGARVGMDYKIHDGKNFVGRGDEMDIQILGDNAINRKNHTIIVYDSKKMNPGILPGDAAGLADLNDEAVYVPTELKPYDTISLGNSRFLFVPLCGTSFSWDDVK